MPDSDAYQDYAIRIQGQRRYLMGFKKTYQGEGWHDVAEFWASEDALLRHILALLVVHK